MTITEAVAKLRYGQTLLDAGTIYQIRDDYTDYNGGVCGIGFLRVDPEGEGVYGELIPENELGLSVKALSTVIDANDTGANFAEIANELESIEDEDPS